MTAGRHGRRSRRGAVLVMTLVVMAALVALLTSLSAAQRLHLSAARNAASQERARLAALSGIQRALSELETQNPESTTLLDDWAVLGSDGGEAFRLGKETFRIQIVDAASLVNLNYATEVHLQRLPMSQEQIDSLLDWRESGQAPRAEGAKDDYYNALATPYNARLGAIDSFDELLLIRGFTPAALFEPQSSVTAGVTLMQGSQENQPLLAQLVTVDSISRDVALAGARIDLNGASQQQLFQAGLSFPVAAEIAQARLALGSFSTLGSIFRLPAMNLEDARLILDGFGIGTPAVQQGRVNVNTASESVLASLPGMTPDVAQAIVARQTTGFLSLGDLFDVPGYTLDVASQNIDFLALNSQTFFIRAIGVSGRIEVALEALAVLEENSVRLDKVWRSMRPAAQMKTLWGWADAPTLETVLSE